jgi:alpha-ketoglutarate-dependent taurine dioxygenase
MGNNDDDSAGFASFLATAPEQRTVGGVQVPFVLSPPSTNHKNLATAASTTDWVRTNRAAINAALTERGAVLFRGFPLESAEDFNTFVAAFDGWKDLSYEKSMSFAVRTRCTDRICTTNEGKSGGLVFHHEQAQTPLWPSHVFFCCLLPAQPGDGGATGITPSDIVYERLKEKYPEFMEKCETEGVHYTVYAGPEQDASKGAGRSWKSFFHVETREECELKMSAGGWDFEWGVGPPGTKVPSDFLKCTTPVLDAVKLAPGTTDRKCFFNQLIATTANALEFSKVGMDGGGYDPLKDVPTQEGVDACVCFGGGGSLSLNVLLDAKQICEELAVEVCWQKGDVVLLSNYLMMHARRPWSGPEGTRKLLASLVAEQNCTSFGKPLIAL